MTSITPLTGKALLARLKDLDNASRSETAKACGYYSITKTGRERINFTAFYEALLAAKGVAFDEAAPRKGRHPSYTVRVQSNGNLLIGSAYTKQLNLQVGDEFEIKLGRRQIRLVPVNSTDEESED